MWGILCGLFVLALWAIHASLTGAGVAFTAWHWVGLLCWLLWSFFGAAVVWTFLYERQARAAGVSAALFGSVSLVTAGVLWLVVKGFSA
jgi:hypothetical protein